MNKNYIDYIPVSSYDSYLFHQGNHFRAYDFMGANITEYKGRKGVSFTVWAPNAQRVSVVGNFNKWDGNKHQMKRVNQSGIWNIFISGIDEWQIFKYEIHTKNGEILLKSDPYSYYSEYRPNNASVIVSLDSYQWDDQHWMENRKQKNLYEEPLNIYELHLGSWRKREDGSFYNYREIADELIDHVLEMGYTHIEILPLMEHPFDGSWGYQITGYYSITSRYGTTNDFMYFVDKCHQKGIGVILDWVPGHFCKDAHGLWKFDGSPLYESDNPLMAENLEWGTANFDHGKKEVVSFLISNALFWFEKYHIDGLRVDAVSHMLYLDYGKRDKGWVPNKYGGRENLDAIAFLKKLNKTVFEYYPSALMIAEESTAWPLVTAPTYVDGLGFNFKWNMGWMNDTLRFMKKETVHRKWHHDLITFSFTYAFSENYILPLSHDEVVHGKKSLIEKMPGDYWQKFANLRILYAYMFAHPGKKLLFMGGEFAQFIEWNFKKELDWFLMDYEMHKKMKFFIKDINKLYKKEKSLYQLDCDYKGFNWIDHENHDQSIIAFMRKSKDGDFIIFICNFTEHPHYNYKVGVPKLCEYEEILNSDWEIYGGSGLKNKNIIKAEKVAWHYQPYSINIKIPPLGALFIKSKTENND
ncbi:1,4-alpha-glucan branching protein GlgB [Caldisalinibacter kiritimatiensis]|uniref:1,4-alpha-glucan branching enzyme GlgB n=1 Tax=Caldisalinibacter kiritimatiensis TaxID=1304284 RepID=R1CE81_9FIRM|nr:1,4-alpha-glucan branching protein GlgB [Caldisalinibacter kiritimatiensis]EOD00600.1 1,4-alpha-glucan (glycogen) branching enzyme, GH-13-type [Caldisalinibacter kiritimatiensis]